MVLVAVARPVNQPRLTGLTVRLAAVGEIFPAVERPDMRWIAVAVGPPDAELLFVRVDPSPQHVARHQPVGTRLALDAYDIGGMPAPIAATEAAAMIRAVARSLPAGRDGLPVIVAKAAGDAGRIDLARTLVERPQVTVDAGLGVDAFVDTVDRAAGGDAFRPEP